MKLTKTNLVFSVVLLMLVAFASSLGTVVGVNYFGNLHTPNQPFVLNADSAASGEQLSFATGIVDRDKGVEGLFVLDHLSGNIQCWIVNPRTGSIAGLYTGNVIQDLQLDKAGDADFVMTTGSVGSEARRGNMRPSASICYVGDGNTGRVVGYTFLLDSQVIVRNETQQGELKVVARGFAREEGLKRDN